MGQVHRKALGDFGGEELIEAVAAEVVSVCVLDAWNAPDLQLEARAWAQEATFSRKKLNGKAVVNNSLMEACVGLLSLRDTTQKRRLEKPVAS